MKIRTNVKAGGIPVNRCEKVARARSGLKVKTNVKAGRMYTNRCEKFAR